MGAEYQLVPVDLFHPRAKVPAPPRQKRKRNQTSLRVNQQHACLDHRLTLPPRDSCSPLASCRSWRTETFCSLVKLRAISRYVQRKYKSSGPDLPREGSLEESAMVDLWLEVEAQQYEKGILPIFFQIMVVPVLYGDVPDEKVVAESVEKLVKVSTCTRPGCPSPCTWPGICVQALQVGLLTEIAEN
ncbi:hypothetical protein C4D60_Mb11t11730 [Musa balbisiana]|uniref:glutathione transferase n=1 Tax=Musa balbisiana TaxID=52838 RepID=A0A4S8J3F3_MUSBA|nr:hypothetical protein C4D60_Mb11t11730 [Musa balbisiana]